MNRRMYRGKERREECTNHRAGREECTEGRQRGKNVLIIGHEGKTTEGRQGGKIVLIIGHEGKTVQREVKEG